MYRELLGGVAIVVLFATGCGARLGDDGTQSLAHDTCSSAQTRCQDASYQVCVGGLFQEQQSCIGAQVCDSAWGCVASNGCGSGADLIYVLDETGFVHSFNPRGGKNEFRDVGKPNCPGDYQDVNSMSVDRHAQAWVSTHYGAMFLVDLHSLSCRAAGVHPTVEYFFEFGMGFVSNGTGSSDETLYIAGGYTQKASSGKLGRINPNLLTVNTVGVLSDEYVVGELTGTGAGDLFGYFPTTYGPKVTQIDKLTGRTLQTWLLPILGGKLGSYAFAHWGGKLYIFVTAAGNSRVQVFDPKTGVTTDLLSNLPFEILGAGVSTCAPLVIG